MPLDKLELLAPIQDQALTARQADYWRNRLAPYEAEDIQAAVKELFDEGVRSLPQTAVFVKRLPKLAKKPASPRPWYLNSGEWGGPWEKASIEALATATEDMASGAWPGEPKHVAARREEFYAMAKRKGVDVGEIQARVEAKRLARATTPPKEENW